MKITKMKTDKLRLSSLIVNQSTIAFFDSDGSVAVSDTSEEDDGAVQVGS